MDLLNLSQPWDCERFPKSKTICYGGGGGGGNPVKKVTKAVSSVTPTIKVDPPKLPSVVDIKRDVSGGIEDVKRGASSTIESVKSDVARSDLGSGAVESAVKRSDLAKASEKLRKEGSNAVNIIREKGEEFKQYAMGQIFGGPKDDKKKAKDDSSGAQGPGGGQTMGQGGTEGLKGGAQMAEANRSRIRQNKRKLRIARA